MPAIMIEEELGKTIKVNAASGPRVPGRYDVNYDGVTITADTNGVLSAVAASISNTIAAGHKIGTITNADGTSTDLNETITVVAPTDDGFNYTNEDGVVVPVTFTLNTTDALNPKIEVKVDGTLVASLPTNQNDIHIDNAGSEWDLTDDELTIVQTDGSSQTIHFPYKVTSTTLPNGDIQVFQDGVLKFTVPHATVVSIANTVTGHKIADVTIEGVSTAINETVTTLAAAFDDATGTLTITYTNEDGTQLPVDVVLSAVAAANIIPAGHKIFDLTINGVTTDFHETVTAVNTFSFDAATGLVTLEYTDEAGVKDTKTITVTNVALGNMQTTGHKIGDITINGVTTDIKETITSLALGGSVITYTDEAGVSTPIDIKNAETTTTYVDAVTGTKHKVGTYTNEDGVAVDVNETVTTLAAAFDDATGTLTLTYSNEDGSQLPVDVILSAVSAANIIPAGHKIFDLTINGVTTDFHETVTALNTFTL